MNGTGTQTDPYLVATAEDFNDIRNTITTTITYYKQTADIDMVDYGNWISLSISASNLIDYDGQNFTISNISSDSNSVYNGFFGNFKEGLIHNVKIHNIFITVGALSGTSHVVSNGLGIKNVKINNMYAYSKSDISTFSLRIGNIEDVYIKGNVVSLESAAGIMVTSQTSPYTNISSCRFEGNVVGRISAGIVALTGQTYYAKLVISMCSFKGHVVATLEAAGICYVNMKIDGSKWKNDTIITDCSVSGVVEGYAYTGGICVYKGYISEYAIVDRCICDSNIYSVISGAGIAANTNHSSLVVKNCYALMNKIVRKSGTSLSFGRITTGGTLTGPNYALDTMKFYDTDDRV